MSRPPVSNFEVQQTTETVYRYHCLTCGHVSPYITNADRVRDQGQMHEAMLCPGRPKKQPKVNKGDVL